MDVDEARSMVVRYRELAKTDPATYEPELGLALYALCKEQKGMTGPVTTSYMDLLKEGIALHRRLVRRSPNSVPQLGLMLCWLGFANYRLGWTTEARDQTEEGLGLIRSMARAQADVYEPQLALALGLASMMFGETGDHHAAVSTARESVTMWRELVEDRPGEHDTYLSGSLHTLCFALQGAGRDDEVLAPAEESVTIARRLRARDPGAHARLLANGLDLQVMALVNRDRWEEALPVAEEAVLLYKEARRNGDGPNSLNDAGALNNLSKVLWQLGRISDAKTYALQASTECLRRTRDTDNVAELVRLASDVTGVMAGLGMNRYARVVAWNVNRRLNPRPRRLGKVIAWLRGG